MKERTLNWQLQELQKLVDLGFVKTAKEVKGAYTTGDYVTWLLNRIFTPAHWSFTILQGPEIITLSDKTAYAQVVGRLEVTFIGGHTTHQDDIGIWPLVATGARKGGTLDNTSPERYETVSKAARTDCLKNASYNLGTCFAPLSDTVLVNFLQREEARNGLPPLKEPASKSAADLFGIAADREGETLRREVVARNNTTTALDRIAQEYHDGTRPVPGWVGDLRTLIADDPKKKAPIEPTFTQKFIAAAQEKGVPPERLAAYTVAVCGQPPDKMTFGQVRVLMPMIRADTFTSQVSELFA